MTIEHAPGTNGRGASGEAYDAPPRVYVRRRGGGRRPRRAGPIRAARLLRLLMPVLMALAVALVLRGIAEAPAEDA